MRVRPNGARGPTQQRVGEPPGLRGSKPVTLRTVITSRTVAMLVALLGALSAVGGCTSDRHRAQPVAETPSVRRLEQAIAVYAQSRRSGRDESASSLARCEARLVGFAPRMANVRSVYLELLCAQWSPSRRCVARDASSGLGAAEAVVSVTGTVNRVVVDNYDDQQYSEWVDSHFPVDLRYLEEDGPRYGHLLSRRMTQRDGCP